MNGVLAVTAGLALATTAVIVVIFASDAVDKFKNGTKTNSSSEDMDDLLDPDGPEVQFVLFTRNNYPYNLMFQNGDSLEASPFNKSLPTKIIIHGFLSNIMEDIVVINKDAYLETGFYNIIGMDWSVLCEFEYLSAIKGVQKAGNVLADFINWLSGNGVSLNDIHLIGHSLGAHIAGIGSHKVGRVGRITGLDPARPGFNNLQQSYKLDPGDATMVDVIHTYMQILGLSQPMGHVDFYPNGGRSQPGCPDIHDIWKMGESLYCNHARAYWYFAESIRHKRAFKSKRCKSVKEALEEDCSEETNVYMGDADTYQRGLYYVKTRQKQPFSLEQW